VLQISKKERTPMIESQKTIRALVCTVTLLFFATAVLWAQTSAVPSGSAAVDKNAVNSACSSEAAKAGCGNQTVGHGLLKCIHAYKQAHKDFRISPGCRSAMKQLRGDARARKAGHTTSPKTPPPSQ
jgi:hypothetical protein